MKEMFGTIALITIGYFGTALAEQVTSVPGRSATIDDGEGHSRILLPWAAPTEDENVTVSRAIFHFEVGGETEERLLRVRLYPITSAWTPETVDWANGWSSPGGDIDEEVWCHATIELERGSHTFAFDVTNVVKEVMEEGYEPYGFLITSEPSEGIGLQEGDLGRFSEIADGSLEVSWRRVPPKPSALNDQHRKGD